MFMKWLDGVSTLYSLVPESYIRLAHAICFSSHYSVLLCHNKYLNLIFIKLNKEANNKKSELRAVEGVAPMDRRHIFTFSHTFIQIRATTGYDGQDGRVHGRTGQLAENGVGAEEHEL